MVHVILYSSLFSVLNFYYLLLFVPYVCLVLLFLCNLKEAPNRKLQPTESPRFNKNIFSDSVLVVFTEIDYHWYWILLREVGLEDIIFIWLLICFSEFWRNNWGEQFSTGNAGYYYTYYSTNLWYECGVSIPEALMPGKALIVHKKLELNQRSTIKEKYLGIQSSHNVCSL